LTPKLYQQYFVDKQDERRELFSLLAGRLNVQAGIYPGSFVHITPAFYIPEMAFIDSDRRMNKFFQDELTHQYINKNKVYEGTPDIFWAQADYSTITGLPEKHYDIMFSFYAGFISQACKKFLRPGGVLISNNSHGDASLAIADTDYKPIGVIQKNDGEFSIQTENIEDYVNKKNGTPVDIDKVTQQMRGEKFMKDTYAYIFRVG